MSNGDRTNSKEGSPNDASGLRMTLTGSFDTVTARVREALSAVDVPADEQTEYTVYVAVPRDDVEELSERIEELPSEPDEDVSVFRGDLRELDKKPDGQKGSNGPPKYTP